MQLRIRDHEVERAAFVVDAFDAAGLLKQAMGWKPQGRPRTLSLRTFLIAGLLAMQAETASFKATAIHKAMMGMSQTMKRELGVRLRNGTDLPIDAVYTLTKSMRHRLAYSEAAAPGVSPAERQRREAAVNAVADALLDGSIIGASNGWYALDGTGIYAWASPVGAGAAVDVRAEEDVYDTPPAEHTSPTTVVVEEPTNPPRRSRKTSGPSDPDAGFGWKTAKIGGREIYHGYVVDAAARIPSPTGPSAPILVERLRVSPASTDVVAPSLSLLDQLAAKGSSVTDIVVDRHYSFKRVDKWADQLRGRRIRQHIDMRKDEHGFKDVNGMRLVNGWMHCPATPDEYSHLHRPAPNAPPEDKAAFEAQIERRWGYALDRHQASNAKGVSRWKCPAVAGKVGCPLRPESIPAAESHGLPVITDPPAADAAPPCCTNKSGITSVDEPALRKHEQPYYWGSASWVQAYNLRSYIEGAFGSLKNDNTEAIRHGFTHFVGLPMTTLGMALGVAAMNVRHQRKWYADNNVDVANHPLLEPDPPHKDWMDVPDDDHAQTA